MEMNFATNTYSPYRTAWLELHSEEILETDLPIIDPHHHLWDAPRQRYLLPELAEDVASGHSVKGTVFVECRSWYRNEGPSPFRPVGEVEFVAALAERARERAPNGVAYCNKIVGHADLTLGDDVEAVLEGLLHAGGGRLAGIRQSSASDSDPFVIAPSLSKPRHLLLQKPFQKGFRQLVSRGLSFDAFMYHHQISDLSALARAFPEASIVLDHLGSPIGIGSYMGRRSEIFLEWKSAMTELAQCPRVSVKLGGLGMQLAGFDFHRRPLPPTSVELAIAWKPYIETCIEIFGVDRCMFESNFPPDKGTCSYGVLWNSFKRLTTGYSANEKARLYHDNAARVYGIGH
jgi:predicted TIM-barrel fold metal-dependent hydrolase